MDKEIRQEVESELGCSFECRELEEGLNTIYVLDTGSEKYVLKVLENPENRLEWFRAEPKVYRKISRETDIPSPQIVAESFGSDNYSYYLMEKLEGRNPDKIAENLSQTQLEEIMRQYGAILGKLHSLEEYQNYGFLHGEEEGELKVGEDSGEWAKHISSVVDTWIEKVESNWNNPPEITSLVEDYRNPLPQNPPAKILHCDNRLENLLIQGSDITAFLDWTITWVGHTEYDLARAEYLLIDWDLNSRKTEDKQALRSKLIEGYRREHNLEESWHGSDRRKIYRYVTTLFLAAGFCNWGQNLDKEEHEEVRKDIAQRINQEEPKEFLN